jgi:Rps23 Pro-64 3,4-dihydroxylase Tpa1-like proline 4-hydroxylase
LAIAVKGLHYQRKEKSRPDVPALASAADIESAIVTADPFFQRLKTIAEKMFPGEALTDLRAYVNSSVYGDSYYSHRDCPETSQNVTVLYYANLIWQTDWGGETIFYNDDEDAVLAVSPRPGRVVVARGAILHRANVPTRSCYEERLTVAYKLMSSGPK